MAAALEAVQTAYGKAEDYVTASPVATYYATYSGGMPLGHFMLEWAPLLATIIFPVLCLVFAGIGLCAKKQTAPTGHRIVKRVGLAVRADVRMMRGKSYKGPTSLMEKGRSPPNKGKAAGDAEAAAIKKGASKGGKGGRFY